MKSILLFTALLFFTIIVNAKADPENFSTESVNTSETVSKTDNTDEEVVINLKMIEKFNNSTLPEGYVSFNTLVEQKSFDEISAIVNSYRNGEIKELTAEALNAYSQEHLEASNTIILLSEQQLKENNE